MLISIRDASKRYRNQLVSFPTITISTGITLLYGANGSGKSTLCKMIAGFLTYQGTIKKEGTIMYCSEELIVPYRVRVGQLFEWLGLPMADVFTLAKDLALSDSLDKFPSELSKGMRQKLRFILTFLPTFDVYLYDEPFSGVDDASITVMKRYMKESKKTIIIASHLRHQVAPIADSVITLD